MNQFLVRSQEENEFLDYLKTKYASVDLNTANNFGNGNEEIIEEINQQSLLPTSRDPCLWMVQCHKGQEKATALLLMRKYFALQSTSKTRVWKKKRSRLIRFSRIVAKNFEIIFYYCRQSSPDN